MKSIFFVLAFFTLCLISQNGNCQVTNRERPKEWDDLILGGRFMDRFLSMPVQGPLTSATWGAKEVRPRYIDNGLEDTKWSYWGGNPLMGEDGKYHLYVCRWPENAEKGHMDWPNSLVVHAVADNSLGPYEVKETIGKGHNPETFRLKDGRFVIYVYKGYYISNSLEGPWESNQFDFDPRDRTIIDGLSNLTFAQREDGSYLMVCRGGGVWFSETGISPYMQVSDKRVYPPVDGRFEDPVIWRTNIQYHMIVNDWLGRIAFYLRSKDGISWKVDPGEAYEPGIAKYEDGTVVDWFKYERIKMLQDELGRSTQADFAVIDTLKWEDKKSDNHSSKHICIPLTVGRQINILNKDKIDKNTKLIRLEIKAEEGFNPTVDMDINSLRFGASEEVNFGRGCKVMNVEKSGIGLIVYFNAIGNGFTDDNFAGKLLGKTTDGNLLFGYARLPWVEYNQPALSARLPQITNGKSKSNIEVEVQNFGQIASKPTNIKIEYEGNGKLMELASAIIPGLNPFEKIIVEMEGTGIISSVENMDVVVTILPKDQKLIELHGVVKVAK